jgi:protein-disulfide isomerase
MDKRVWIVLAAVVIVGLGGLIFWQKSQTPTENYDNFDPTALLTQKDVGDGKIPDHFIGPKDAKVRVIEYEDYACSHCQAFSSIGAKIQNDYDNRVMFIHRQFSLNYPNSTATLSAGEAAYLIGGEDAFWKMTDQLFQDTTWVGQAVSADQRKALFSEYAKNIGIDVDKFNAALLQTEKNGIKDKIDRDKALGLKQNVSGTPTWLIGTEKDGKWSYKAVDSVTDEVVRKAIDEALKSVGEPTGAQTDSSKSDAAASTTTTTDDTTTE